ncbi:MAG: HNH endonuclease [Ignavibacteria bacterium]|nr:HNH endonuclease [Ignavibacteria bacterium]
MRIPDCISVDRKRKSRFSGVERAKVYDYLVLRDGERCRKCGKQPPEVSLDIHHLDGDKTHIFHENLELWCHECNCNEHPKGWKKKLNVSVGVSDYAMPEPKSDTVYLKKRYLLDFIDWLEEEFSIRRQVKESRMFTVGALKAGFASEATIKRYVAIMSCDDDDAPLKRVRDKRTKIYYYQTNIKHLKAFREKYCG